MGSFTRRSAATMVGILVAIGLPIAVVSEPPVGAAGNGPVPRPATVVLTPAADTFVSEAEPTTNFGSADVFDTNGGLDGACGGPGGAAYGLLRFDLSSLPAGAEVTGARLELTAIDGFAEDGDSNHHIIDLGDTTFDESTVTWATRPNDGTLAASGLGPEGDPATGSGDIRFSSANLGSANAFRSECGEGNLVETKRFPATGDDTFENPTATATAERNFVAAVARATARSSKALNLEVYNPGFLIPGRDRNLGYWVRYTSREHAETPGPRLIISYAAAEVVQAAPVGDEIGVITRVAGTANTAYDVQIYGSDTCSNGALVEPLPLGSVTATTGPTGEVYGTTAVATGSKFVSVVATTGAELTVESPCVAVSPDNDSWTRAVTIPLTGTGSVRTGSATGLIDVDGRSRWYRFAVQPGARVQVDLTNLPTNYDLALFRDIGQTFTRLNSVADLTRLSAEYAPSVFSPSVFSPSVFSPAVFSPDAYAPSVFSPSVFSPSVFSPSVFSPSVFSPSVFSPSVFSPSVFSPSVFSPSVFSPSVFSPSVFSPDGVAPSVFSPDSFTGAQTRSLISVSTNPGTANEVVVSDTWLQTGFFYLRVSGSNGAFDPNSAFSVSVRRDDNDACAGVNDSAVSSPAPAAGSFDTVIITDPARMPAGRNGNSATEKATLAARLATFAQRPEVDGVVVDIGQDPRVAALQAQADARPGCPFAKNLVATAIKSVIDAYRAGGQLKYVVLVGADSAVPYFRYPDQSLLGPESDYVPPVSATSASEASLRLNYVLGQDEYGASSVLQLGDSSVPVPDLAVGRLVETAAQATGMLDAYLGLSGGVTATPTTSLVTGYDFLTDAADAVTAELAAGTGRAVDTLVTPANVSPQDPSSWTADQLRAKLFAARKIDIAFLAGHFSANSALAADFTTSVFSTELRSAPVDLTNSIVFSAGCHSGYNIDDSDAIPGVTEPLDWVEAFVDKRATLIAGTGYQYGDTDFLEYSERIYASFARELRVGTGPVSVGAALVKAKQQYLQDTPDSRGLHRKALIISALYGLPMISVDMPSGRVPATDDASIVTTTTPATSAPGSTLGLSTADVSMQPSLAANTVPMTNLAGGTLQATYFSGPNGVVTNPAEPAVPLVSNDVSVPGKVLRGVGFRGGSYTDQSVVPLTGAATTELRGVHAPFASTTFFPMRLATVNYFGALNGGDTRLLVTPAQHRVDRIGDINATLRRYGALDLRLFYSGNLTSAGLSDAPSVSGIDAVVDGADIVFRATAVGNPSAGIQSVWVTYTGHGPSQWVPLDLVQCDPTAPALPADCDVSNSSRWVGRLAGAAGSAATLRFVVQAANGVGLVTLDDSLGAYHRVASTTAVVDVAATTLTLSTTAPAGAFGSLIQATATLTTSAGPVAGERIGFSLGGGTSFATTDATGQATVTVPLNASPDSYTLTAGFTGTDLLGPSSASSAVSIGKNQTSVTIATTPPSTSPTGTATGITATLRDAAGGPLLRTVFFVLTGPGPTTVVPVVTNYLGEARLGTRSLAAGAWTVRAQYLGDVPYPSGTVTLDDAVYLTSSATTTLVVASGDATAPTITLTAPVDGATYSVGQRVTVSFSCLDETGGSGLASCVGTAATNTLLDTATAGPRTFTVTATDVAGNQRTVSATYRVVATAVVGGLGTDLFPRATPGSPLKVGVALQVPGRHPAATYTFVGARATIGFACLNGLTIGSFSVSVPTTTASVPVNGTAWVPTASTTAAAGFQVTTTVPNVCGGRPVFLLGVSLATGLTTSGPTNTVNVRWHYQAGTSAGNWSLPTSVRPTV